MRRNGFSMIEILISLVLITFLLSLVCSSSSSLMCFEQNQEEQVAGNEYIQFLRKKALIHNGQIPIDAFYKDGNDMVAIEFYGIDYRSDKDFPHQIATPTSLPLSSGSAYIHQFILLNSSNPDDKSTETVFVASK